MSRLAELRFSGLSEEISNHKTVYEIKTEIETKINSKTEVKSGSYSGIDFQRNLLNFENRIDEDEKLRNLSRKLVNSKNNDRTTKNKVEPLISR